MVIFWSVLDVIDLHSPFMWWSLRGFGFNYNYWLFQSYLLCPYQWEIVTAQRSIVYVLQD